MQKNILVVSTECRREESGEIRSDIVCGKGKTLQNIPNLEQKVREMADAEVVVMHHSEVTEDVIRRLAPACMILSGRFTPVAMPSTFDEYQGIMGVLQMSDVPTLGICMGHQLVAMAGGAGLRLMKCGAEPCREDGFREVRFTENDLFAGETAFVFECHRSEIDTLPEVFELIASSNLCHVQCIRHKHKPQWGMQFHPELYTDQYSDGKVILQNFLKMYGVLSRNI